MDAVSWALGNVSYDHNKPVLLDAADPSISISASQARNYVRQLIAGFKARGLQPGDAVCILSLGSVIYPLLYLAIIGAGGQVAAGNPGYTSFEIRHLLTTCSVKFVIASSSISSTVIEATKETSIPESHLYFHDGSLGGLESTELQSWTELLTYGSSDWIVFDNQEAAASTVASLCSTSGTTGSPKFAAISHANWIVTSEYLQRDVTRKLYAVSRLIPLPLMHAFAIPLVHFAALRTGVPTYIMKRFSTKEFCEAVQKYKITDVPLVPSIISALLASPLATKATFSSIREVLSAGAPLSISLAKDFNRLLSPEATLHQLYGLTEAGWVATTANTAAQMIASDGQTKDCTNGGENHAGIISTTIQQPTMSIGAPLRGANISLALRSPTDSADIAPADRPGATGELLVKAPHPFLYYVGNEAATSASYTANREWYCTGDLSTVDSSGRLYLVDRIKDLIKVRGWQVAPAEIENVLLKHPLVADAAVIGIPDATGSKVQSGEVPCAFVVRNNPSNESTTQAALEAELMAHARKHLAAYKMPAKTIWISAIPRNPAGKILKWKLAGYLSQSELSTSKAGDSVQPEGEKLLQHLPTNTRSEKLIEIDHDTRAVSPGHSSSATESNTRKTTRAGRLWAWFLTCGGLKRSAHSKKGK